MTILITGGAGYIGSHTLIELDAAGYGFVVYDNLSNASLEALRRVERIIGKEVPFVEGDIRDRAALDALFARYTFDAVIHFAGLKAVGESVAHPLRYYDNNVNGTLVLLESMQAHRCKQIVFSSSATVYGDPASTPIRENFPVGATTNPYGRSKYIIEEMLQDLYTSDPTFRIAILRYFNPVGAHASGTIGEDPNGIPNNLMPFVTQVAVGKREYLNVFGGDYPTHDGTGVRDYIHVVDLAIGHVKAIDYLQRARDTKPLIVNLGTGKGYSVLDVVQAFERASGRPILYKIVDRRAGDIATCFADPAYAKTVLGWEATRTLEEMCSDSWRWQSQNPNGYAH
ncbi:MAG: UDP-galactose-4-epimerase [Sulfurovum sp. PC08-66]|nr:MAG: UDP-galactose-4-epimerase [Sulfurovum sp. PC08-66]KIM12464.1 MAG: UDP-galactose-4-epimerase [Sulfuricurvum sp. PC08-66]